MTPPAAPAARIVVAVDGIDGSGKSVLAARLAAALGAAGTPALLLRIDDFRRPIDWSADVGGGRSEADVYYDRYYDLAEVDRCLAAFLDGAATVEAAMVAPASAALTVVPSTLDLGGATALVLEGVFTLRVPTVAARAALVYLATDVDEARRRILARDTARGRSAADVTHRIDARYFPAHRRYLEELAPQRRADAVIDNQRPEAPRILALDDRRLGPAAAPLRALLRAPPAASP